MNYDKKSVTAFLDQVAPFNDESSRRLLANPIIRGLAEDVESLYIEVESANKCLDLARKVLFRQRRIMVISGVLVLGYAVYETDKKRRANQKETKDNTIDGDQ